MNKKILTSLMATSIVTLGTLTAFAATTEIPKSASLQEAQKEITAYENKYAMSAKAYEEAANVPAPDYIRNGTEAPGLVSTVDPQTAATASIIMDPDDKETASTPDADASAEAIEATGPMSTPIEVEKEVDLPSPGDTTDEALKAIITDPKNANNKPMDTAVFTTAMAHASR